MRENEGFDIPLYERDRAPARDKPALTFLSIQN
jgi:hypothetical protein